MEVSEGVGTDSRVKRVEHVGGKKVRELGVGE